MKRTSLSKKTIFTVGHSRHTAEHFVSILRAHEIERVVDVRSHPASKWAPHFAKAALAQMLGNHTIQYVFLGRELGGRPEGSEFYRENGAVDYERRAQALDFKAAIERLVELARERRTAILCAEENPARCHRRLLIAPALRQVEITVLHIRGDGRAQLEDELREGSAQLSLFRL